ncbi:MAG: AAA family ATPase [Smithellaceae bacterium]|jgi:magnesium chelatase subunit D
MNFQNFIGHDDAKLALILNALDSRCGGVLFVGEKGSGKSTLARLFKNILPPATPFVNLPLHATEEALLGGVEMEETIKNGRKVLRSGLLQRACDGVAYIDDVNLLSPEIIALILKAQSSRNYFIGKGNQSRRPLQNFMLLASMNPEEGYLSSHFLDRFGMCVFWEGIRERMQKMAVMKTAISSDQRQENDDQDLRERICGARMMLEKIIVPVEIRNTIAQKCIENVVCGHRGDIFLFYAARAYAALCNAAEVTAEHVDKVLPLVLLHRRRMYKQMEEDQANEQHRHDKPADSKNSPEQNREKGKDSATDYEDENDNAGSGDSGQRQQQFRESRSAEEIFNVGDVFNIRRLAFRKDRMNRTSSGRRTKTGSRGKQGRKIKSIMRANGDIAVDATIRAAAPFQIARGRSGTLLIEDDDLRFKQREKKMGHLAVLVVDGSGSMGAKKRMIETKGAVQSLLLDCYQKRDKVSLIVFRKDAASVVLPPTASVEAASRRLQEIPVGGKTPLTAGLLETYKLMKNVRLKSPQTRFLVVLVTDGRANQSFSGAPVREEIAKMAGLLGELPVTDFVVIDTEDKKSFLKADLACEISGLLGADYYRMNDLQADHLTEIIRDKKAAYA